MQVAPVPGDAPLSWVNGFEPDLTLVPPLSPDFRVYGGPETVARARQWAVRFGYLTCEGLPVRAHFLSRAVPDAGSVLF